MKSSRLALGVSAIAFVGMVVTGCSGSGGPNSTPTPSPTPTPTPGGTPTPTPSATYSTVAEIDAADGDKRYNAVGVRWQVQTSPTGRGKFADGTSFTFDYVKSDNTYRVSYPTPAPSGSPAPTPTPTPTPTPSTTPSPTVIAFSAGSGVTVGDTTTYTKSSGSTTDTMRVIVPQQGGVDLTYTRFLAFDHDETGTASDWHYRTVYGILTYASDRPTTGTATYSTSIYGDATRASTDYLLTGNSSGTFSVDFAGNTVTSTLDLKGRSDPSSSLVDFGSFTGSGTIVGVGYTGTLTGSNSASGEFGGAFFGPQAAEYGYAWYLNGSDFTANGFASGKKNP
ncbi:MAG: transferrin-binding protein-like solute binding protein [Novosphingobium sp.]|nr:transferrin-binding protein-like solute binding protein [Novosphingobium sp.]